MSEVFYITTAIDYTNGQPHLGHAYEKIVTDVIARAERSFGRTVFFLTGLDEHGQKVQQAALKQNKSPQVYCDELAASWRAFTQTLELSISDFIRTTDVRHHEVMQALLLKLNREGHLYKAPYEGYYSTKEETFLTERDRRPDGTFDPSYGEVSKLVENNYYFRLQQHQPWLIEYIEQHPDFIVPDYRRNEVLGFLKNNLLEDLCISRPIARLSWGIPFPLDPEFVVYVWFDALVNYITVPYGHGDPSVRKALGSADQPSDAGLELWPAEAQVIGKDILKFHAVYWPIMLKVLGLPLPKQLLVHGWWQKDGEKISKATGNIVDPLAVISEWGIDAFRYYVVRELDIGPDGNWTDSGFAARYHADLANGLGNLLNRSLTMVQRYRQGIIPPRADDLAADAARVAEQSAQHLAAKQLQASLETIWQLVTRANRYIEETAPFKIAKDPGQAARLDTILYNLLETCRVLAVLLQPFLPSTAARIYQQLGLADSPRHFAESQWGQLKPGATISEIKPLFPRKDQPSPQA